MPILSAVVKRGIDLGKKLKPRSPEPQQLQVRTLRRLLRKACHTSFGQYYDFKELLRSPDVIRDFRQKVPIHDYDLMHDRWWHMTLNGVADVTWKGRVHFFALSSGTSGAPSKHLPITEDMLRAMRRASLRMLFNLPRFKVDPQLYTKDMLMLGGSTDLRSASGYYMGDLSGINASKLPFWFRPFYKPGTQISRIDNWNDRIEEIARHAPEWDVSAIVGIPAWLQLTLERIIEVHQLDNIHQIWPNLTILAHGGVHFEPYRKGFERLLAHPLIYIDTYLASEGFIAFQARPETNAMRMQLHNGIYFEFIPFNEENFDADGMPLENARALAIDEVETGVDYALLLSSCAGAWRYLIGDTVRFTDKQRAEILITGRTKHFLSVCGEHLSVDNMNQGVRAVEEAFDVSIPEFTVAAVKTDRGFVHRWYLGCRPLVEARQVKPILDRRLRTVNDDYATERDHLLRDIQVTTVPPELFYQWQEKQGKLGGQNKFPRVMKEKVFNEWEAFLASRQIRFDELTN